MRDNIDLCFSRPLHVRWIHLSYTDFHLWKAQGTNTELAKSDVPWQIPSGLHDDGVWQSSQQIYVKILFYHDVGESSDLSQSEALNLVMWIVRVMQPMTPSPWRRGRSWLQWKWIHEISLDYILQDKTNKKKL